MIYKSWSFARRIAAVTLALGLTGCGIVPAPFDAAPSAPSAPAERQTTVAEPSNNTKGEALVTGTDGMAAEEVALESQADTMAYGYMEPTFNTEEYDAVQEAGFVSTKANPLSTVSADVDTASYANLRRMLLEGYRVSDGSDQKRTGSTEVGMDDYYYDGGYDVIPTGAVRIEEMVNYFDYDYPAPQGEDAFAISAHMSTCPWNKDTELLMLGYATAPEDQRVRQKGSNLVFLIDVSGSMDDPDKLPLLQSSFAELVDQLGENDRVSIVTYSGEEQVVLEGESGANHRQIMQAIRSLKAEGSTNGEAGLRMAYDIAQKNMIEGGVNRIVMASDGDLNVGMTSESDLHDFVEKKREGGVYLSVLGFGAGNYKDSKMETLADHGNGSYHYVDCEAEAKRVFGERLTANLVPFANDVKVQVEFNPAQIKAYRLIGYENRTMAAEDFTNDAKDAGEVGPESQFTVLYEVVPVDSAMEITAPELKYGQSGGRGDTQGGEAAAAAQADQAPDAGTSDEWLTAKLRYKPLGKDESKEQELVVSQKDWTSEPGEDWKFAASVAEFGMILRNSEHKGTATYDTVRELAGTPADELRQGFLKLVDLAQKN